MSRRRKGQKKAARKHTPTGKAGAKVLTPREPIVRLLILKLLAWPRIARIALVTLFALAVALVISLVLFYDSIFYAQGLLSVLAVVALVFGLADYLVGWHLIVGTVGEVLPVRRAIIWYLAIGLLSIIVIVLWILQLLTIGTT